MKPQLGCTFNAVLEAAKHQWPTLRKRVVFQDVVHVTGVGASAITRYAANQVQQIDFTSLGLIGWYFGAAVDDLFRLTTESLEPATTIDQAALPALQRNAPPERTPAPESVIIINRMPGILTRWTTSELEALTGWPPSFISRLLTGGQQRIAAQTLATLLGVINSTKVSDLIQVVLDKPDWISGQSREIVAIAEQRPTWLVTDWVEIVKRWRDLADDHPAAEKLSVIDVAAIRWLMAGLQQQRASGMLGRDSRLGNQWAAACGVSRQTVRQVVQGAVRPSISASDCPADVVALLQPLVEGMTTMIINQASAVGGQP